MLRCQEEVGGGGGEIESTPGFKRSVQSLLGGRGGGHTDPRVPRAGLGDATAGAPLPSQEQKRPFSRPGAMWMSLARGAQHR